MVTVVSVVVAERLNRYFQHVCNVYEAMLLESAPRSLTDGETFLVYSGYLSNTYNSLNISQQYKSSIFSLLDEFSCIRIIERGVRNTPSTAIMLRHPRDADIPEARRKFEKNGRQVLTTPNEVATLEQSVRNLAGQIGKVNLPQLAQGLAEQLAGIESRLAELERRGEHNGTESQGGAPKPIKRTKRSN